jgi:hypothetical protein
LNNVVTGAATGAVSVVVVALGAKGATESKTGLRLLQPNTTSRIVTAERLVEIEYLRRIMG